VGGFVMDLDEHTATLNDEEIALTIREFNILYYLAFARQIF
jgi:DNA-binding response OmpR family regulator